MFTLQDLRQASALVREAAAHELMTRFNRVDVRSKADGSLVTDADLAMQARLERELGTAWPAIPLLGEEMSGAEQQALMARRTEGIWILDPLDGTSNFANGIPWFGISLALLDGEGVLAGIVYDPCNDECFSALRGTGAWLNGEPLQVDPAPRALSDCMAMVDLKRLPDRLVEQLAVAAPYRSQRSFGSVALDWCWVAAGRCQVYMHGGQKLWDFAAGYLVLRESGGAGGLLADYQGEWLPVTDLTPRIALAASNTAILDAWRAWVSQALEAD